MAFTVNVQKAPTAAPSPGKPSFVQRLVNTTFTKATGTFSEGSSLGFPNTASTGGANTVTLKNLRTSARISMAGGSVKGRLDLLVWGMPRSLMDQLSTLGINRQFLPFNTINVQAGDAIDGMASVYTGTTIRCWGDYNSAPEVSFHVEAIAAAAGALLPSIPTSIAGSADVATMLSGLASQMNLHFENNGVTTKLGGGAYYYGSAYDQAAAIVHDANINWNNCNENVLAIWPNGGSRGGAIPFVGPGQGLIGYPTYIDNGIQVKCVFNRSIGLGGQIQLSSSLTEASKTWVVLKIEHALDSMLPKGLWESNLSCYPIGTEIVK